MAEKLLGFSYSPRRGPNLKEHTRMAKKKLKKSKKLSGTKTLKVYLDKV